MIKRAKHDRFRRDGGKTSLGARGVVNVNDAFTFLRRRLPNCMFNEPLNFYA